MLMCLYIVTAAIHPGLHVLGSWLIVPLNPVCVVPMRSQSPLPGKQLFVAAQAW